MTCPTCDAAGMKPVDSRHPIPVHWCARCGSLSCRGATHVPLLLARLRELSAAEFGRAAGHVPTAADLVDGEG